MIVVDGQMMEKEVLVACALRGLAALPRLAADRTAAVLLVQQSLQRF